MVDTLGDFSLKILNSQINDVNNNLVKISNNESSMGPDELDFTDYEYILTPRIADSQRGELIFKSLEKKNILDETSKNLFVDTTNEKILPKNVKCDNGSNENVAKFSISSSSIPSDVSFESIKKNSKKKFHSKSNRKIDKILYDSSIDANDFQSLKITFV